MMMTDEESLARIFESRQQYKEGKYKMLEELA
jgi:hypothetical protein